MFREHLLRFQVFLEEEHLGALMPEQYELTYVNHIPQGEGWKVNGDIGKCFLISPGDKAKKGFFRSMK